MLFADEPTGNLDSQSSHEVLELLRDAADAFGQTTVMVTHDNDAAAAADRLIHLEDGLIVADEVTSPMSEGLPSAAWSTRKLRTALTALAIVLGVAHGRGRVHRRRHHAPGGGLAVDVGLQGHRRRRQRAVGIQDRQDVGGDRHGPRLDARPRPGGARRGRRHRRHPPGGRLIDKNGKAIGDGPYFGMGYDAVAAGQPAAQPAAPQVRPLGDRARRGRHRRRHGAQAALRGRRQHQRSPPTARARRTTIVGIARFGDVESLGTATVAVFDLKTAQSMFAGHAASYDDVLVAGRSGHDGEPAAREPACRRSRSSTSASAEAQDRFTFDGLKQFISIIKTVLLVFGFIAIFVGAFTIYNTLSITVAQRARELATLRTIGASRRQVLGSVITESAVVALVGSAVGHRGGLRARRGPAVAAVVARHRPAAHVDGVRHAHDRRSPASSASS